MSGYFARLAASHGAGSVPGAAQVSNPARPSDLGAGIAEGQATSDVDAVFDAAPPASASPSLAPALPAPHPSVSPAASPEIITRAPAPPVTPSRPATSTPAAPAATLAPAAAAPIKTSHAVETRLETREIVSQNFMPVTPAAKPAQAAQRRDVSRATASRPRATATATPLTPHASVPAAPLAAAAEVPASAVPFSEPSRMATLTQIVSAESVSSTPPPQARATAHAEPRITAPVVAPVRDTQVNIGRVELIVSAPPPAAPARRTAAPRSVVRAPAPARDTFSVHRHYLKVR